MAETKQTQTRKPATGGKAQEAPQGSDALDKGQGEVLRVRATTDSFRRAGITFGRKETVLKVSELSEDQIGAIKAEKRLLVIEEKG